MNFALAVAMGILGLAAGWWLPFLACRIAELKSAKRGTALPPDRRYTGLPIKVGAAVFTLGGWAAAGLLAGHALSAVLMALLWAETFVLAAVDIRIRIIPNELVLAMAVLGAAFQLSCFGPFGLLYAAVATAVVMVAFLILGGMMGSGTVGAGDVKLAGAMGLTLGYPFVIYAFIGMGAALGIYCLYGFAVKKLTMRSMLPFAPFMMMGMAAALVSILFTG